MFARSLRLGSLRAGSQVIRAHWVWRVNDERGRARITCSLALRFGGWSNYFLDEIAASGCVVDGCDFDFGACLREVSRGDRLGRVVASEANF